MMNFDPVETICRKLGITRTEWQLRQKAMLAATTGKLKQQAESLKLTDEILNKRCTL